MKIVGVKAQGQAAKAGAAELRERRSLFAFYIKKNLK
jgi:hypothetical protein